MQNALSIKHISNDLLPDELIQAGRSQENSILIDKYWSGVRAPKDRWFSAECFWSSTSFYIRFETALPEQLVISDNPDLNTKSIGLWERDVCEIFIAPDKDEPRKYFEFEVAPTGEWFDLAIDLTDDERVSHFEYESGIQPAARIEETSVLMAMKIPWDAFAQKPQAGDVWLGNIFRCVGKEPDRGYLAWRPTETEKPNFHVPSAFGKFEFE